MRYQVGPRVFRQMLSYRGLIIVAVMIVVAVSRSAVSAQNLPATVSSTAVGSGPSFASSERTFRNGSVRLSGTLYVPNGSMRAPAIVVFHDASVPTRDLPLYKHLVTMMPPLGIAVFVYDRRGSGKSGGNLDDSGYNMLADDGIAAQEMLRRDPQIDPKRVGFWGLSQGGWLSLLAASRSSTAAFAIAVSAPMTTADVQMNFAVANILRIKGYSRADIDMALAARTAVDRFEAGKSDRATAQSALEAVISKPWFNLIYLPNELQDPNESRWAKVIKNDPLKALDSLKLPVLIMYGTEDAWVPAELSVASLRASAARHPSITVQMVNGADHEMMLSVPPAAQIDPAMLALHAPDAPAYFGLLASWLTRQGIAHPPGQWMDRDALMSWKLARALL